MLRVNSPRTSRVISDTRERTVMGDIQSASTSVNILHIAEKNQQDYPNKIVVLHSSGEVTHSGDKALKINNTEMIFYDNLFSFVDRVVTFDLYPHGDRPIFDDTRLDIIFTHKTAKSIIHSNYMLFSEAYYLEAKRILEEIVG
ncbi:hypothetical protein [Cedratvirus kamchatka]|uniref:Uncharacterized protein n=1 Tax=Cedratvirus kamchatka TaxID=2716914 RepID=A0A6G8MXX3_9VIRU|nr:hypothetical protein [Cedratvirus kamchatka]WIL04685.1 hypothetical protein Cduv_205 [Cedratvirus duvanny]